jgi:hypothetical protein
MIKLGFWRQDLHSHPSRLAPPCRRLSDCIAGLESRGCDVREIAKILNREEHGKRWNARQSDSSPAKTGLRPFPSNERSNIPRKGRRTRLMLDPESGRVKTELAIQFERTAPRYSKGLTHVRQLSVLARFCRL